jgi:hypothetical protein
MNTKYLSHAGIAGLLAVVFAPVAFAQSEQIRKKPSIEQQIQQRQREQTQAPEQISPNANTEQQEKESDPAIRVELERLRRQQQIQQQQRRLQEIEERAERDMLQEPR